MLPLVWGLWCLTLLMQGRAASGAFLPCKEDIIFQAFDNLIKERKQVTHNCTDEKISSEKTVTSTEQGDALQEKKVPKPVARQAERDPEADRRTDGVRFFTESLPLPRPRLAFLIFRLSRRRTSHQMSEGSRTEDEPISDKKHRLLAIRNGLLTAPRPTKKRVLSVPPQQKFVLPKRRFFFFWRKI